MMRSGVILAVVFGGLLFFGNAARVACPTIANHSVNEGWNAFRLSDMSTAASYFKTAHGRCPEHVGALVGLGYVAFRQHRDADAHGWFERALEQRPDAVDALAGHALLAWRQGDLGRVHTLYSRVLEIEPFHPEALGFLDVLPEGFGPAPVRPPLERPDTVEYMTRTRGDRFEVRTPDGWRPYYINGVNLGAALPGRYPSEFPDSATYADWLAGIAEMGANTVRIYTVHPPSFYAALHDHNTANPDSPLRLIHGIWAELPPGDDYDDRPWLEKLQAELRSVVDLVHGRADIEPRRGHAGGHYVADVSRWTLALLLSREWEPHSVLAYTEPRTGVSEWAGRYLEVSGGNAMDVWLARLMDYVISYETVTYGTQRPVAYTTWPPLDPLTHVTESTIAEDWAIRRSLGEDRGTPTASFDEDAVAVDPSLVRTTDAFRAGYFAAYHVYPYAPDFLVLDPEYNQAVSPFGRSAYYGYLRDLKRHHDGMPLLVAEYGVPASIGVSHVQPNGWHHGGHTEEEMARINARLTREIAASGAAGGILFAWIDEWFKSNWLTAPTTIPMERNRLWWNRLDPEQHYGVIAMEPEPRLPDGSPLDRLAAWRDAAPLYEGPDGARLTALADEAALHLLFESGGRTLPDTLFLGFDVARLDAGSLRWPAGAGPRIPVGIDFVLVATADGVRLLANPEANPKPVGPDTVGAVLRRGPRLPDITGELPGMVTGRLQQNSNLRSRPLRREDGRFDPLIVITNRVRFARDTVEYGAMGYDRGILREGDLPDGAWQRLDGGALEVRIPWGLLNVTDPSMRRVLVPGAGTGEEAATSIVDGIRIAAAWRHGAGWSSWPLSTRAADVAVFTWDTWDEPRWRARRRPVFELVGQAFQELDTYTLTMESVR